MSTGINITKGTPCSSTNPCTTGYFCDPANFCMLTVDKFSCPYVGGAVDACGNCICPPDMVFDITANSCLPASCSIPSPCGYFFMACPYGGYCANNICVDPSVAVTMDPICNQPTVAPTNTCMSYFSGVGAEDYDSPKINTPTFGASATVGSTATLTVAGDTFPLNPINFLNTVFSYQTDETGANNITCGLDPELNVPLSEKGSGGECYFNHLSKDTSSSPTQFLPGVGSGSADGVIQFITTDDTESLHYAGTNFGNYPRQTNLFVMFANPDNVSWLTPNQCPYLLSDMRGGGGACFEMGAGMRCVPGTVPVRVSNCVGTGPQCDPSGSGWHTISDVLPSNAITSEGAPSFFSVWACSAEAANIGLQTDGTSCPTGFEENIIYDNTSKSYKGTCVRTPPFQSPDPTGSNPGLAYNYCSSSDAGKNSGRNSSCPSEGDMCWESTCGTDYTFFINETDTIPYIPLGFGYLSKSTMDDGVVGYRVCSADGPGGLDGQDGKGCMSDLQTTWSAPCYQEKGIDITFDLACSGTNNVTSKWTAY